MRRCQRDLAFNTAASFTTNTNWQAYVPEVTMSYFTQMAGLAYHNFISAAVGIALAIAVIRGMARREQDTIGNFWVDLTRTILWVLLPVCLVVSLIFVSQGVIQNLRPYTTTQLVDAQTVSSTGPDGKTTTQVVNDAGDPARSGGVAGSHQDFRHEWRRLFQRQQFAHPYENPTPLTNFLQLILIFAIPSGLTYTLGRMTGSQRHGWAVWAAMAVLFLAGVVSAYSAEARGNPLLHGVDQKVSAQQSGGNMEGKEVRFGIANSALFATVTTDASCGAVNGMHDSFTPLGGMVPLINIMLGEVVFGGVGSGTVRNDRLRDSFRVHRGTDGGQNAGISGEKDRSLRREDGDAFGADFSAGDSDVHGDRGGWRNRLERRPFQIPGRTGFRRFCTRTRPAREITARRLRD